MREWLWNSDCVSIGKRLPGAVRGARGHVTWRVCMEGFLEEAAFELNAETRPRKGNCAPGQGIRSVAVQGRGNKGPALSKAREAQPSPAGDPGVCRQMAQVCVGCEPQVSYGSSRGCRSIPVWEGPGQSCFCPPWSPQHGHHVGHLSRHTTKTDVTSGPL